MHICVEMNKQTIIVDEYVRRCNCLEELVYIENRFIESGLLACTG